jgi:hypothetical protein
MRMLILETGWLDFLQISRKPMGVPVDPSASRCVTERVNENARRAVAMHVSGCLALAWRCPDNTYRTDRSVVPVPRRAC